MRIVRDLCISHEEGESKASSWRGKGPRSKGERADDTRESRILRLFDELGSEELVVGNRIEKKKKKNRKGREM